MTEYRRGQLWYSFKSYGWVYNCRQEENPKPWPYDYKFLIDIDASYNPDHFRLWSSDSEIQAAFQGGTP
jgi:hypothetical protein